MWARLIGAVSAAALLALSTPVSAQVAFSSVPVITAAPTGPTVVLPTGPGGGVASLQFSFSQTTYVGGFDVALIDNFGTTTNASGIGHLAAAILLDDGGQPGSIAPGTVAAGFGPGIPPSFFATDTAVGTTIVHIPAINALFGQNTYTFNPGTYWLQLASLEGGFALPTFTTGNGDLLTRIAGQTTSPPGVAAFQVLGGTIPPVPEPGQWALLIAGFGLVGLRLRQQRRAERFCRALAPSD